MKGSVQCNAKNSDTRKTFDWMDGLGPDVLFNNISVITG